MKDPNQDPRGYIGQLMMMISIVIFVGLFLKAVTE